MIIDRNFSPIMEQVFNGRTFSIEETSALVSSMFDDTLSDLRIAAVLTALRFTEVTPDHLVAIVDVLKKENPLDSWASLEKTVDICGTGNDQILSMNISAMASLLAAACGARVAKFAGKSSSRKVGSADLFSFLDIPANSSLLQTEQSLKESGFAYIPSSFIYPALNDLSEIRKILGFKTIVDFVFPLVNPAPLFGQLVGVHSKNVMSLMALVLKRIGRHKALIVHGEDGLDEISVCSATNVIRLQNGVIEHLVLDPRQFGIPRYSFNQLQGGHLELNAKITLDLFAGQAPQAIQDAVCLNAAGLLWCADSVSSIEEGLHLARSVVSSGKAKEHFQKFSQKLNQDNHSGRGGF